MGTQSLFWKSNQITNVNLLQLQEENQRLRIQIIKLTAELEKLTELYLKIESKIPRRQKQLEECKNRLRFYDRNPNSKNDETYRKLLSRKEDLVNKLETFYKALEKTQPEKLIAQKHNELNELQNTYEFQMQLLSH